MASSALVVCRRMTSFTDILKANVLVSEGSDCSSLSGTLALAGSTDWLTGGSDSVSGLLSGNESSIGAVASELLGLSGALGSGLD